MLGKPSRLLTFIHVKAVLLQGRGTRESVVFTISMLAALSFPVDRMSTLSAYLASGPPSDGALVLRQGRYAYITRCDPL